MNYKPIDEFLHQNLLLAKPITEKTTLLEYEEKYLLKREYKDSTALLSYLSNLGIYFIPYPIFSFKEDGYLYYLYPYLEQDSIIPEKKIFLLKDSLEMLYQKTSFMKEAKKNSFKKLYRLYKRLNHLFLVLDSLISQLELKEINEDMDWIILSKYHIFLDCKKEMYRLQTIIHAEIDKNVSLFYCAIHGNPSVNHFISNYLISNDQMKMGFVVSDIARFYVENSEIKVDMFSLIDDWLGHYEGSITKPYFKFLVLYIYLMNLRIDINLDVMFVENYVSVATLITKTLIYFKEY